MDPTVWVGEVRTDGDLTYRVVALNEDTAQRYAEQYVSEYTSDTRLCECCDGGMSECSECGSETECSECGGRGEFDVEVTATAYPADLSSLELGIAAIGECLDLIESNDQEAMVEVY